MKNIACLLVLSFCLIQWESYSQGVIPYDSLDGNNVNVRVHADGYLGHNVHASKAAFIVPKDSGQTTIYGMDLWIAGRTISNKDSFLVENTFRTCDPNFWNYRSFYPIGPIANSYSNSYDNKYRRLWKVSKSEIDYHKQNAGTWNYNMIDAIENWPAHGDTTNGEAFYLAPFIDWNQDGVYNPELGDYPCIKGDQAIYVIYNSYNTDSCYEWSPVPIEVHQMSYSFNTSNALNNTVFIEYKIVNRGLQDFENVFIGKWIDFDIGFSADDFIGCDSNLNLQYAYNGDLFDEDGNGNLGYGTNPPFCGAVFLNQKMSSFIYYDRGTNPLRGDPQYLDQHYNYLQAIWKDGSQMKYGGNGHPSDTNTTNTNAKFMFPSDPRDSLGWNEPYSGNPPFDRKGLSSIGPINILSGTSFELALAIVTTQDSSKSGYDVFDTFKADVNFIQNYYDNNIHYCQNWATGQDDVLETFELNIYPNPARNELNVEITSNNNVQLSLFNVLGEEVLKKRFNSKGIHKMDVSSLNRGFYLLIYNDGKNMISKKLLLD